MCVSHLPSPALARVGKPPSKALLAFLKQDSDCAARHNQLVTEINERGSLSWAIKHKIPTSLN